MMFKHKKMADFQNVFGDLARRFPALTREQKEDVFADALMKTHERYRGINNASATTYFTKVALSHLYRAKHRIDHKPQHFQIMDHDIQYVSTVSGDIDVQHIRSKYGVAGEMVYDYIVLDYSLREMGVKYRMTHEGVRKKIKKTLEKMKHDMV